MQLFYSPNVSDGFIRFDEEESRHLLSVLRHKPGDLLRVTDGKGSFYEAALADGNKKQAVAWVHNTIQAPIPLPGQLHIAIAPTKQIERLEWFLEKATEIGIHTITPLQCAHSERTTIRTDRLEKILVSAMKQSLRAYLPELRPLTHFQTCIREAREAQRFIAWCNDEPMPHLKDRLQPGKDTLILIGPEGDFSPEEVQQALDNGFEAISLGAARLRTETAGMLTAAVYATMNNR